MGLDIKVRINSNKEVFRTLEEIPPIKDFPDMKGHKHEFGEGKKIGNDITLNPDAKQYSCEVKGCIKRAYYCPNCKGHLTGVPYLEEYNEIRSDLAGSEGHDIYCVKCGDKLGRIIAFKS